MVEVAHATEAPENRESGQRLRRGRVPFIERAEFGLVAATLPVARSPLVAGAQHMFGLTPGLEAMVFTTVPDEKRPFCLPPTRTTGGAGWNSEVDERVAMGSLLMNSLICRPYRPTTGQPSVGCSNAGAPMPRTPLKDRPLAFIDTETTGLDPRLQEVIEVAVILEKPDGTLEEWCTKVRPTRLETAEPYALKVNGYEAHPELWATAPTFPEIVSELARRLDDTILVGHNVGFDLDFLQEGLIRAGSKVRLAHRKLDTYTLAYEHLAPEGLESLSLDAVCSFLGISNEGHHTALVDARRCRAVWHTLCRRQS